MNHPTMRHRTSFKLGLMIGLIAGIFLLYWPDRAVLADNSAARAHLDSILQQTRIGEKQNADLKRNLGDAERAQRQLAIANDTLTVRNAQLENAFFTPTQKRWLLWIGIAIFVLLGIGLISTGMIGTLASGAAHGLLGVATFGISLITTLGDNLWFRIIKPRAEQAQANQDSEAPTDGHQAFVNDPGDGSVTTEAK